MLKLENITKVFNRGSVNEQVIFENFSLDINDGDFITILGSNGAGKSTLLNIISGKIIVNSGKILLDNLDITNDSEYKRCKIISRIFQDPSMGTNPSMTIYENLSMAKNKGKRFGLSFMVDEKDEYYFKELLKVLDLGLEDKLYTRVSQLSGGQRQALALIMAAVGEPSILLLDEHTAALDPKTSQIVMDITDDIVMEKGLTTLMITHNIDQALEYGNRLIMLHDGRIVMDISGSMKKSITKKEVLSLFKKISECKYHLSPLLLK